MAKPRNQPRCIAVIGDVVASRRFHGPERERLQRDLRRALDAINSDHASGILSRFLITTGDEFQGLLCRGTVVVDVILGLETALRDVDIRVGVGLGHLETELRSMAVGMDGPVWHNARDAIDEAESERRFGGVLHGFGPECDAILNGFARLLWCIRSGWTDRQREVVGSLGEEPSHTAVAKRLGVTRQAIGQLAQAASWQAYSEGITGWRTALERFDYSDLWDRP